MVTGYVTIYKYDIHIRQVFSLIHSQIPKRPVEQIETCVTRNTVKMYLWYIYNRYQIENHYQG